MEIPSFSEAEDPQLKITEYLLSLEHPEGGSKARFFLSRGFSVAQWRNLAGALRQQAIDGKVSSIVGGRFGGKFVIDAAISCPDGSSPNIRTVWIVVSGRSNPRLVTAYPLM